jgi:hypothetical protein
VDVLGSWMRVRGTGKIRRRPRAHEDVVARLCFESPIFHPTVVFRTGPGASGRLAGKLVYDPLRPYAEDYDLWVRLALEHGARFANLPEPMIEYRVHEGSVGQRRTAEQGRTTSAIRRGQLERLGLSPTEAQMALHDRVSTRGVGRASVSLGDCDAWLAKLARANATGHLYPDRAFARLIQGKRRAIARRRAAPGIASMKIGLLVIATGRYRPLAGALIDSARKHFFTDAQVEVFLFGDVDPRRADVRFFPIEHEPWPMVTLKRYHAFDRYADALREMDFVFYCDADMRFVAPCDASVLPPSRRGLVAVHHPAYFQRNAGWRARLSRMAEAAGLRGGFGWHVELPFERNPDSKACLADRASRTYYAGGFNGGERGAFLEMAARIRRWVDEDLARGVVARWHDESHLNRYLADHPPHGLTPAYCYPERGYPHLASLSPVLLALEKDHRALRREPNEA